VLTLDRDAIAGVLSRHPELQAAWVFGSVARGEARHDSDLDVAVLLEAGAGPDVLGVVSVELERHSPSGRVDVIDFRAQGPVLRHRVLSEGVLVLDAAPRERIDAEGRAHVEYLDWKPTHDIAMRVGLEGLAARFRRMGTP
jgi:hypothetical protein